MNFTERLANLINKNNTTKNKMLLDLNLGKSSYGSWEVRGTIPSGDTLSKIADYFDVSVDYLLGREDASGAIDLGLMELETKLQSDEVELVAIYRQLNKDGKQRLLGVAQGFTYNEAFKKDAPITETAATA